MFQENFFAFFSFHRLIYVLVFFSRPQKLILLDFCSLCCLNGDEPKMNNAMSKKTRPRSTIDIRLFFFWMTAIFVREGEAKTLEGGEFGEELVCRV